MTIEPIRRSLRVASPPQRAFHVFSQEMTAWWPLTTHSRAAEGEFGEAVKAERVVLEPRPGGRFYEITSDGQEASWGEVLVYDPPRRLVLAWKPNPSDKPPTEVEVVFTADGDGTLVDFEHRGWERLGDIGPKAHAGYTSGWRFILDERYAAAANAPKG